MKRLLGEAPGRLQDQLKLRGIGLTLGAKTFPNTLAPLTENFSAGPLRYAALSRSKRMRRERQKERVGVEMTALITGRSTSCRKPKDEERQAQKPHTTLRRNRR